MTELKAPSRWWYAVAAAIFVLGFVPLALMLSNAVDGVLDYDIQEFDNGNATELTVDGSDVAIFSTHSGIGTVMCSGGGEGTDVPDDPTGGAQATVLTLDRPTWSLEYSRGSQTWHRVAVTPDDWDDGTYLVTCNIVSEDGRSTPVQFGYADNPSIFGTALGLLIAVGVAGTAALAALVIVIVVAVKRSRINGPTGPRFPNAPPPY